MTYECSHNWVECTALGDPTVGEVCTLCSKRRWEVKLNLEKTKNFLRQTSIILSPVLVWVLSNGQAALFDQRTGINVHVATFPSEYWAKRYAEMEYDCDPTIYWQEGIL